MATLFKEAIEQHDVIPLWRVWVSAGRFMDALLRDESRAQARARAMPFRANTGTGTSKEIEQPFVDIVETAVGHDQNNVTGFGGVLEIGQDGLRIVEMNGIPPPGF